MGSINETLLGAIINDEQIHLSGLEARNARILQSIIDGTPYTAAPESPIEELLLELKVKIEQGGGGGLLSPGMLDGTIEEIISNDSSVVSYGAYLRAELKKITLPNAVTLGDSSFQGLTKLEIADLGACETLGKLCFSGCSNLSTIIFRIKNKIVSGNFTSGNASLKNTPFYTGDHGTLYVPAALVNNYLTETPWKTWTTYGTNQVLPIEGSIYE